MTLRAFTVCVGLSTLAVASGYQAVRPRSPAVPPAVLPSLVFDPPALDLGEAEPGDALVAEFTLTNRHPVPVRIDQPIGSCSCQSVVVEPATLVPGQSGRLVMTWKPRGRPDNRDSVEHLLVTYTAEDLPFATHVDVRAAVRPAVTADPPEVRFGPGRPAEQVVVFTGRAGTPPVQVTAAGVSLPGLRASVEPDGRSVRLTVVPGEVPAAGGESALVAVVASDRQRSVTVPLVIEKSPTKR